MAGGWLSVKKHALEREGSINIAIKILWLGLHLKMGIARIQASLAEENARNVTSRLVLAYIQANTLCKAGFQKIQCGILKSGNGWFL